MRTEDMLPVAAKMDEIGFYSLEVWGGATFDSCLRFLNEDPWERLRAIRREAPNTPLQMLLRGQNLVGYRHYPDDVVDGFVRHAKTNGIDIFRVFDALNDTRNMSRAMRAVRDAAGHVQATICYTISPVHDIGVFVSLAKELEAEGADSLCLKDMAGLLAPYEAYVLVSEIKAAVEIPLHLHCHYTSGMASATYLKATEAGLDGVDAAISSLSQGTSQPPVESLVRQLQGTPRDPGLDLEQLSELARHFSQVRERHKAFESGVGGVDVNVLTFQIPGGMISNLTSQLREQGALDRYQEVLAEVPRVRADLGYPPLVTPSSQMVGTQATLNVLLGERYAVIPNEVKAYIRGLYGKSPGQISPDLVRLVEADGEMVECRPADLLPPELDQCRTEVGEVARCEEDVLTCALFPQVGREFMERRNQAESPEGAKPLKEPLSPEVVAAIAVAFAQPDQTPEIASSASEQSVKVRSISPWKMASRREMIGGGWRQTW
jgi:pyruvate/oxaloacetate carboxyltransferase